ncbi:MAG: hypothetical protein JWP27_2138 [Flaviaesturariibacter sp.]|nr:hypothetical protein [Flaviaesturariibacter sp.]
MRTLLSALILVLCFYSARSQVLCTGSLGDPIVNITFGSGPGFAPALSTIVPGASTTYQFVQTSGVPVMPVPLDGSYSISNAVPNNTPWFLGQPDHTAGDVNGYMAFFNADPSPAEFYRQTVNGLCENTKYEFAAWIANALNPAVVVGQKPDITFVITKLDGTVLGSLATGAISQPATFTWQQFGFFFVTPPGINSVILKMTNTNPGGAAFPGNDFVVDDITFRPCGPAVNASFSSTTTQSNMNRCGFAAVTLYGSSTGSGYTVPAYLWQYSSNNGTSWTDIPASNNLTINFTPPAAGSYLLRMLTGESTNIGLSTCRVMSNPISLTVNAVPQASLTGGLICSGSPGNLTFTSSSGTGPFSITYTDGVTPLTINNLSSPATIPTTPPATTVYTLMSVTDATGCVRTSGFTNAVAVVSVVPRPVAVVSGPASICKRDSTQLLASGGATYTWTPITGLSNAASANPKASPSTTTTYHVVVSNAPGCEDAANVTVTVQPVPVLALLPANPAFCAGDSVQLTSSGATLYQWSPALGLSNPFIDNPKAAPAASTTYKLVGSFASGCRDSVFTTVIRNEKPDIGINPPSSICRGDSMQLNAGGGGTYVWTPATGLSSPSVANPKASPTNDIDYQVVVTSPAGCQDIATTRVTVKAKPVVGISADQVICRKDSTLLNATGGGSYAWSPTAGLENALIATPKASPAATTSYQVVITGINGCTDSARTNLTVNQLPVINVSPNGSVCERDSLQLTASGGSSYAWTPASGLSNAVASNPKASPSASTRYRVLVTNDLNCADSAFVNVDVRPKPVVTISPSTSICAGDSLQLSATGGTTYLWAPAMGLDSPLAANPKASPAAATQYIVTVTNAQLCSSTATTSITINPKPKPNLGKDSILCPGQSIVLDGTIPSGVSYTWNTGVVGPQLNVSQPGTYTVAVQAGGCLSPAFDTINIIAGALPVVDLGKDTTFCSFDQLTLFARGSDISNYLWSTGATGSSISVHSSDLFSVVVSNSCGTGSDQIEIIMQTCSDDLFFPSVFTPNNDGHNDLFRALFFPGVRVIDYELAVFDRWGKQVFSTKDVSKGWNGIVSGRTQASAVYVWLARYRRTANTPFITKKGTVLLVK